MSASDPMEPQGERLMVEMASTVDGDGWWRPVGVPLGDRQLSLWASCWVRLGKVSLFFALLDILNPVTLPHVSLGCCGPVPTALRGALRRIALSFLLRSCISFAYVGNINTPWTGIDSGRWGKREMNEHPVDAQLSKLVEFNERVDMVFQSTTM
ncbi:hypothetical protein BGZ61DRAFT_481590 [Ilyonectria robusta]|uniref:uncharacterized protein n=1 Tax=Ilyonectria robusta TaxID=1079257 RepID=UPI001E8DD1F9|nr:uncharacterized protein BGZ61DRAFT_481590 [Ilyonectria robusta]KAH8676964.1 hypothetical protein BGZ61DRAFT_481590 [Ilyonectria robusta]